MWGRLHGDAPEYKTEEAMSDEIEKVEVEAPKVESAELSDGALDKVAGGGFLLRTLENFNNITKNAVNNTRTNS
jgi:hypothetical protein